MSNSVITQGYGTFGNIAAIILEGYGTSAHLDIAKLSVLSMDVGSGLSRSIGVSGNLLPLSVETQVPSHEPVGGKGIVFVITGGVLKTYGWNGSAWVASN